MAQKTNGVKSLLLFLLGAVLFVIAVQYAIAYLLPFLLALALTLLIDPVVDWCEFRFGLPRGPVVAVLLLVMVGTVLIAGSSGVARLVTELADLYEDLPLYWEKASAFFDEVFILADQISEVLPPPLQQSVDEQWSRMYLGIEGLILRALMVLRGLPDLLIISLFALLGTYFLSRDKRQISRVMMGLLPPVYRRQAITVKAEVFVSVLRYVKIQAFLILLTMVLHMAGLLMLRANFAVVIGLVAGVLDVLPIVGPALIFLPWSVYAFLQGELWLGAGLLLLNGGVSLIRHVATVHLLGGGFGLHPLTTLLSLYLGIRLLGPLGLIIGPLIAISIKAVFKAGVLTWPHYGGDDHA